MRNPVRRIGIALLAGASLGFFFEASAQAAQPRPITGYKNVDEAIYVLGTTCGMGSLTAAKVIDSFILAVAPNLASEEKKDTTTFGNMVQQLQKQDELRQYGYKGPVRRFIDRYCIIGYLTGSGSCDAVASSD